MEAATTTLALVADLYQRGLFLQAYAASEPLGPLHTWEGTRARIMAGRLANQLGSIRLGRVLHGLAWRNDPDDCEARYFYAMSLLYRRGPWSARERMRQMGPLIGATPVVQAEWFGLESFVAAIYRDFEVADRRIGEATRLVPDNPWLWIQRSVVLDFEDRRAEALESARHSLELRPWYLPGILTTAHQLVQVNRDDEALDLLRQAAGRLESGDLVARLAELETDLGQHAEARANLDKMENLLPLLKQDKKRLQTLIALRADAAYYCGDLDEAARLAATLEQPFYKRFAGELGKSEAEGHRRVMLPVGFVRQHHVTCAPATLTALSLYWSRPADHLEVAEQICYDGTPAHSERRWAEENGFVATEFRVTWDAAGELVDRGVPFTLTTVETGSGHLQAVIGYDTCRRSLLVRDPSDRHFTEFDADLMFERFRSTGPGGMALAPIEEAGRLDGLDLPESGLYDELYRIQRALQAHDREAAGELYARMEEVNPDHRLTLRARGALANYDADVVTLLRVLDQKLGLFPDDANLLIGKLNCLRELGRRDERIAMLSELCRKPGVDPAFFGRYAGELAQDARNAAEAEQWLRRALRLRQMDGAHFQLLADLFWSRRERLEALDLYRIAACLDERNEARTQAYFVAARFCRKTTEAMKFLEDRVSRFGRLSGWPVRTLCWAFEELDQAHEAFEVLDAALKLRPNDGELLLFAADFHGRFGRNDEAQALLDRAADCSRHNDWLRTAASLAMYKSDLPVALDRWRQVVETEPLARDANEYVAQLMADLGGPQAAEQFLRDAVARFPHSYTLRVLLIEWLGSEKPADAESAAREMLESHPADTWGRRELAIALLRQHKYREALVEADLAAQLDPNHPTAYLVRALAQEGLGKMDKARAAYRQAIHVSADYTAAIDSLMATCRTRDEREEELRYVREELVRQVITGDGLLSYREHARGIIEPEVLLAELQESLGKRPDLWHAHAAVAGQLVELGRLDQALAGARVMVERFPLLPRVWLELAQVHRAGKDSAGEVESLRQALEINPSWGDASRQLAECLDRGGDVAGARHVLEQAVVREPRNPQSRAVLAGMLWKIGEQEKAVENIVHVVRMKPGYPWPWSQLREWAAELKRPELAMDPARELTRTRPQEAQSWTVLAQTLLHFERWEEALDAADRAIGLNPRDSDSHSARADCLAGLGRYEEAIAACRPDVLGDAVSLELRGKEADLQAQSGDIDTAIGLMRRVVEQEPDYTWGWWRLADWYEQTKQARRYLEATEQMVRTAPHLSTCWGYRGHARLVLGDRAGSEADFRRALELEPEYGYAAGVLMEMKLEDCDAPAAAEALAALEPSISPSMALAHRARVAACAGDQEAFMRLLDTLCHSTLEDASPVRSAVESGLEKYWGHRVEQFLSDQLEAHGVSPHVGIVWAETWSRRIDRRYAFEPALPHPMIHCINRLKELRTRGEIWVTASRRLMEEMREERLEWVCDRFLNDVQGPLRNDIRTWSAAGEQLLLWDRYRATVHWLRDWEQREGLEPSMLFPLVYSFASLKRRDKVEQVARRALELPPDNTTPRYHVWLAMEEFLRGHRNEAAARLGNVSAEDLNEYHVSLYRIVNAAVGEPGPETGPLPNRETADRLRNEWLGIPRSSQLNRIVRRYYRLCRWRLASDDGNRLTALLWWIAARMT